MLNILFAPLEAIALAKEKRNIGKTFLILFVASILASLNVFITTRGFSDITSALWVFLGTFLFTILIAFLLQLALHVLSQSGGYFEALTTVSYGFFIISCGYLISSLINLIPSTNTYLKIAVSALSGLVLLLAFLMSQVVILRTAMELFETDLFTVAIAIIIIYMAIFWAIYLVFLNSLFASMFKTFGMLGGMGTSLPIG